LSELRFDDRVAIVTGGGGGLGREQALSLASRGAAVVVADLGTSVHGDGSSSAPAEKVADEIRKLGGRAVSVSESVADEEGVAAIVGSAVDAFGRLDILVHYAGIQRVKHLTDTTLDDFVAHLGVHMVGAFLMARAAWPHLIRSGAGRIVIATSTSALGITGYTSYASAKAGLIGLTRVLALEGQPHGIAVNAIAPSAATRMAFAKDAAKDIPTDVREAMARTSPPSLVAPVVTYLCHSTCGQSGEVLFAGGGRITRIVLAETPGIVVEEPTPEIVAGRIQEILDDRDLMTLPDAIRRAGAWAAKLSERA
jgi:NAD(P)-dependent dehydrogenase (short-subunit alcohol dehydrogenase family)